MEKHQNSIGERLSELYKVDSRASIIALSEKFQVAETTVRRWLKDELGMSTQHLVTILEDYPDLNVKWFLTGEGAMFITERKKEIVTETVERRASLKEDVHQLHEEYLNAVKRIDLLETKMLQYEKSFDALNKLIYQ